MTITIESPDTQNLFGLIIASILEKNLNEPKKRNLIRRHKSLINIQAGKMKVNLTLSGDNVTIKQGFNDEANAYVKGTLGALLNLGLRRRLIRTFLTGEIKIGGNILRLLPLMKLISI
jgi:ubiquinone biosynthesis protein UbiJ